VPTTTTSTSSTAAAPRRKLRGRYGRRRQLRALLALGLLCGAPGAFAQLSNPPPAKPLSGYGSYELHAVELDPADAARKGKDKPAAKIQEHFDQLVAPLVDGWNKQQAPDGAPRLVIEPRIESVKFVGGGTRFMVGALAGSSYVSMRVRLVEQPGDVLIAEPSFYQRAAAMSGAWSMGAQDNDMLRRIAQIVADYLRSNYDNATGGPTGRPN
jgi:hypothetical protein